MAEGLEDTTACSQETEHGHSNCGASTSSSHSSNQQSPSLRFTGVQTFLFRRKQGFNCVPTKGGTTLGMADRHFDERRLPLRDGDVEAEEEAGSCCLSAENSSNEDIDESGQGQTSRKRCHSPVGEKCSLAELRPLPIRQRRRLLRLSGVKKIDTTERFECEAIRLSRNECGCQSCGPVCLPKTCPCSVNGIACQVDKMAYPCSCTREGCRNVEGRVEFNASRVRKHLVHTLTKLYAASNEALSEDSGAVADEDTFDDNCDHYGRCRFCNIEEPPAQHHPYRQSQQQLDSSASTTEDGDEGNDVSLLTIPGRQTSTAIAATRMLRRKLVRHWRQQAQLKQAGGKRLVNKLFAMRRVISVEKLSDSSSSIFDEQNSPHLV